MTETDLGRSINPEKDPLRNTISRKAWGLRRRISILQTACLASSLGLVLVPVLYGAGVYVSGMVGLFLPMVTQLSVLATAPFALYRMIFGRKRGVSRFGPVAALIVSLTLVFGFNIGKRVTKWNFQARMVQRMQVVAMVERGDIPRGTRGPCDCFYSPLPRERRNLSAGHEILVTHHSEGISVTFFVARWGLFPDDDYTAFIYRTGSGQPQTGVEDTDRFIKVQEWAPHWFFVEHT
jgi:hypothetical protein